ncbi:alkyl sulfatase dimerization domain-containing protein [Simiduia curdlanivorans]|uniref:Alkyl/aryl-sulfatase n=1 Tax=Simiduia curdlanivorans TaxID=1492769 RepID=A0ABV8V663_9GAMM|nr:alkyl sulfatase dimerization domain-containing protein [Simiduia curdlanivorans]MDN3640815.1 alkyl sulfatase dimerization domain-containing protein [Simiduia curdlanivorans]
MNIGRIATVVFCTGALFACNQAQNPEAQISNAVVAPEHFHPKGKEPSSFTKAKQAQLRKTLPLTDARDFEEQSRGLLARPDYDEIMAEAGHVAWSMGKYEFLLDGKDFDSIHPSLQRQALLNMNYGLYEVTDGIYQVRGFDLANISFIKGDTGWIVFDPLTAEETARAALKLINDTLGERPVVAVIYSHSHGDHFGGARGVTTTEAAASGKVKIIAPAGFMEHAVAENVHAGNAMSRRMFYQYGSLMPASPYGHVDQSIGKTVANGKLGLIAPNLSISEPLVDMTIDGVHMVFQNTPGTEAPVEMNTWFPDKKAFWAAENISGTIHNIYTLRGALVRDALAWSKYINIALYSFGKQADVMFTAHSWPRWGNDRIQQVMRGQRDMYAHLNNQVLHLANQGVTINQMHNVYQVPKSQQEQWYARGYHGSFEHNSRAVINRYLGYWDANPATLIPLSPEDSAPLYVEMMGGAEKIMSKAQSLYNNGEYRLAQEITNKLVYAEPNNQNAKDLLADIFEQQGYQQESPSLRNSFLAAALELRSGIPKGVSPKTGPDIVKAMSTELWLEYLAILMNADDMEGVSYRFNLIQPDIQENFVVELSNGALTAIKGFTDPTADLTLTINRADLEPVMMQQKNLREQVLAGKASVEGDTDGLRDLLTSIAPFELDFEIMPGTK